MLTVRSRSIPKLQWHTHRSRPNRCLPCETHRIRTGLLRSRNPLIKGGGWKLGNEKRRDKPNCKCNFTACRLNVHINVIVVTSSCNDKKGTTNNEMYEYNKQRRRCSIGCTSCIAEFSFRSAVIGLYMYCSVAS